MCMWNNVTAIHANRQNSLGVFNVMHIIMFYILALNSVLASYTVLHNTVSIAYIFDSGKCEMRLRLAFYFKDIHISPARRSMACVCIMGKKLKKIDHFKNHFISVNITDLISSPCKIYDDLMLCQNGGVCEKKDGSPVCR